MRSKTDRGYDRKKNKMTKMYRVLKGDIIGAVEGFRVREHWPARRADENTEKRIYEKGKIDKYV